MEILEIWICELEKNFTNVLQMSTNNRTTERVLISQSLLKVVEVSKSVISVSENNIGNQQHTLPSTHITMPTYKYTARLLHVLYLIGIRAADIILPGSKN